MLISVPSIVSTSVCCRFLSLDLTPGSSSSSFFSFFNKTCSESYISSRSWSSVDVCSSSDLCGDEHFCCEKLRLFLATLAAGLLFPLLVWGGYALLPFEAPQLGNPSLRVLYTLRCSFFATIPVMLGKASRVLFSSRWRSCVMKMLSPSSGVLVQGVARLRFSALKPLYQGRLVNKEVMVHRHYVNESMPLFLFYFLQLAVMATYISQDLVKLVPLLTIIFVFGRYVVTN